MNSTLLGFPGPWASDFREQSDHYTSKIGGLPDWPVEDFRIGNELLDCVVCGERLCLVAQVYAPISMPKLYIEERVIYILGCRMPECGSNPRSWRAIRVQKCPAEGPLDSTNSKETALKKDPAPISKGNRLWGESLLSFEEFGDESDDDIDLEDLGRALSEATSKASQASQSKKQNAYIHHEFVAKIPISRPQSTEADASLPVMPCFYIYTQKQQFPGNIGAVCANYSSLSIKENEISPADHEDGEKYEAEAYEYDIALGADRTYLKFKKHMDAHPEQCFRYSYSGKPLLATINMDKPDLCRHCGSSRHYEMQLMPPLLYFLHQATDETSISAPEWSWMTLIIYTCSNNCCLSCEEKSGSCCWAVAEEAIIIQDDKLLFNFQD